VPGCFMIRRSKAASARRSYSEPPSGRLRSRRTTGQIPCPRSRGHPHYCSGPAASPPSEETECRGCGLDARRTAEERSGSAVDVSDLIAPSRQGPKRLRGYIAWRCEMDAAQAASGQIDPRTVLADPTERFTIAGIKASTAISRGLQPWSAADTTQRVLMVARQLKAGVSLQNVMINIAIELAIDKAGGKLFDKVLDALNVVRRRFPGRVFRGRAHRSTVSAVAEDLRGKDFLVKGETSFKGTGGAGSGTEMTQVLSGPRSFHPTLRKSLTDSTPRKQDKLYSKSARQLSRMTKHRAITLAEYTTYSDCTKAAAEDPETPIGPLGFKDGEPVPDVGDDRCYA